MQRGVSSSVGIVLPRPIDPGLKILEGLIDESDSFLLSATPIIAGICKVSSGVLQAGYATVHHAGLVDVAGLHFIWG